jgi:hypothetical protein
MQTQSAIHREMQGVPMGPQSNSRRLETLEQVSRTAPASRQARETMSDCGVCIYNDDAVHVEFFRSAVRHAAKEHKCCECDKIIAKGERYEYASGKCEGEFWDAKTCLICAEIAEAFSCDGRLYGGNLWDSMGELYRDMNISCVDKLTSAAAKEELLRRWNKWKFRH